MSDLGTAPVRTEFFRYVSQNIMGVLGMSAYFFADTFFISQTAGADGLTALNLILPFFYLIYAIGSMLGIGAATRFTLARARGLASDGYFGNAVSFALAIGAVFAAAGWFWAEELLAFFGADGGIVAVGGIYLRVTLMSAWGFLVCIVMEAFVRNDGSPRLVMAGMLISSAYNIIFDYLLIFPMGLGFFGAALATGTAPLVGILVCMCHFFKPGNSLHFKADFSLRQVISSAELGVSAFVVEISPCAVMILYNSLFLSYAGNTAVAAYGVVANLATMAGAIFSGLVQGAQPLMSFYHGRRLFARRGQVLRLSFVTAFCLAALIFAGLWLGCHEVTAVFNRDGDMAFAAYAEFGILHYFPGFFFSGLNVVGAGFLSATEEPRLAGLISVLRSFVMLFAAGVTLPLILGMTGIWLCYPAAELATFFVLVWALRESLQHES